MASQMDKQVNRFYSFFILLVFSKLVIMNTLTNGRSSSNLNVFLKVKLCIHSVQSKQVDHCFPPESTALSFSTPLLSWRKLVRRPSGVSILHRRSCIKSSTALILSGHCSNKMLFHIMTSIIIHPVGREESSGRHPGLLVS